MRRDVGVIEHIGSQHVLLSQARTGLTVGENLDRVLGPHRPGLRSLTIGSINCLVHVALLGHANIEPERLAVLTIARGRPGGPAEISRSELRRLRIAVVGDRHSLRDGLVTPLTFRAFIGQNDLSVDVLIERRVTTRCVNRVVYRSRATRLRDRRRVISGHRQIIGRRRGDTLRLFAVHSHTGSRDKPVVSSSRTLISTGSSQITNEAAKFRRTVGKTGVTCVTPFRYLVVEVLLTTSSATTVHIVINGIHDADHTGLNILTTRSLTTGNSLIQSLGTRCLQLVRHGGTGDTGLACEPIDTVLTPALGNRSGPTLRVRNSIVEECIADIKTASSAQVATRSATRTTIRAIRERRVHTCAQKSCTSERHQRSGRHGLATLVLSRTRSHRTSLSLFLLLLSQKQTCCYATPDHRRYHSPSRSRSTYDARLTGTIAQSEPEKAAPTVAHIYAVTRQIDSITSISHASLRSFTVSFIIS